MKIETKFNSGNEVWFMFKNKPHKDTVTNFFVDCSYKGGSDTGWGGRCYPILISYRFTPDGQSGLVTKDESECFPTKEELLASL